MAIKIYPRITEFPFTVNVSEVTTEPVVIDTDTNSEVESSDSIDDFLEKNDGINWQTPMEYYSKRKNTSLKSDGYEDISKATLFDDNRVYFWIEDLHNWCTYECTPRRVLTPETSNLYFYSIKIQLFVWNGVNGWIAINNKADINGDLQKTYNRKREPLNEDEDLYHISSFQKPFIDKLNGDFEWNPDKRDIRSYMHYRHRGHIIAGDATLDTEPDVTEDTYENSKYLGPYGNKLPYTVINGFRLQKTSKYSINGNNFITKRLQKCYNRLSKMVLGTDYNVTNVRDFINTGALPVWRMSTNEIFLATEMVLSTDCGIPYELKYMIRGLPHMAAVARIPNKSEIYLATIPAYDKYRKFTSKYSLGIAGDATIHELTQFINNTCVESFGNGNTKTIKKDWLREYKIADDVNAPSDYNNMLDSSLIFEQVNSNDTNTMKCSFKVNRPIVTTDEQETTDYIKKW